MTKKKKKAKPKRKAKLPPLNPRSDLRDALRLAMDSTQRIRKEIAALQQQLEGRTNALKLEVGAREALAKLFLPEGLTLAKAWDTDFEGLRTCHDQTDKP